MYSKNEIVENWYEMSNCYVFNFRSFVVVIWSYKIQVLEEVFIPSKQPLLW